MPRSNTTTTYGSVTRAFHWLTALLILTIIPLAVIANELPYDTSEQLTRKAWLFSLHKTLGVTVFFVAILRILWTVTQPKPASLHPERRAETFLAETAHWLLYGSLILAPLSGWIHHASTAGFAPIWWPLGQNLPLIPKSEALSALTAGLHWVFGKVMAATILLHIAGALKHHFIDKDATLTRMMGSAATSTAAPTPASHAKMPLLAALAVWAVVLLSGTAFGLYSSHSSTTQAAALEEVTSDWAVESGTITIGVTQFGSVVEGSFADWTADISYDADVMSGKVGDVEVVVSIGSLSLGSVTDQAMGPDFFNAENFETATYTADLIAGVDGFVAQGTLTIKDTSMPLDMPFRLSVEGDTADMQAQLTLDRRDFGIGDNMPDEGSLAFAVDVNITLTATRAPSE
ncbi:MAG: cytochrome b/b6 domain-containing protein [Sulfitobacter sp.]